VGVPIEKHAYTVYTRAMYERFYDELFQSGSLTIKGRSSPNTYTVIDSSDEDNMTSEFEVRLPDSNTATCTCGLFEHMGILCKHALKVKIVAAVLIFFPRHTQSDPQPALLTNSPSFDFYMADSCTPGL
jgi:hypothetical protein